MPRLICDDGSLWPCDNNNKVTISTQLQSGSVLGDEDESAPQIIIVLEDGTIENMNETVTTLQNGETVMSNVNISAGTIRFVQQQQARQMIMAKMIQVTRQQPVLKVLRAFFQTVNL
jgi:hypothetical protein